MTKRGKITLTVEKTDTGFSAYTNSYPIFTTGKTVQELMRNAVEAVALYFEDKATPVRQSDLKFEIDIRQFFQYYKVLNAKFLAEKIGMNATLLSQYVQGHKKPSERQTEKILAGIHQIGLELSRINLFYKD
ncbi:MAG: XRE family transcriptional regulator [Flavobacteriales bacterium]|nr:XRE family transcriptional regulator [Flavobacteriales bacterium]